jgi:hypothetical protein
MMIADRFEGIGRPPSAGQASDELGDWSRICSISKDQKYWPVNLPLGHIEHIHCWRTQKIGVEALTFEIGFQ